MIFPILLAQIGHVP